MALLQSFLPPALEPGIAMVLILCSVLTSMITASLAAMISAGLVGTWIGIHLLQYISDRRFAVALNLVLTLLAMRLLWQAAVGFVA